MSQRSTGFEQTRMRRGGWTWLHLAASLCGLLWYDTMLHAAMYQVYTGIKSSRSKAAAIPGRRMMLSCIPDTSDYLCFRRVLWWEHEWRPGAAVFWEVGLAWHGIEFLLATAASPITGTTSVFFSSKATSARTLLCQCNSNPNHTAYTRVPFANNSVYCRVRPAAPPAATIAAEGNSSFDRDLVVATRNSLLLLVSRLLEYTAVPGYI